MLTEYSVLEKNEYFNHQSQERPSYFNHDFKLYPEHSAPWAARKEQGAQARMSLDLAPRAWMGSAPLRVLLPHLTAPLLTHGFYPGSIGRVLLSLWTLFAESVLKGCVSLGCENTI